MFFLFSRAYLHLIRFDRHLLDGHFAALYEAVGRHPLGKRTTRTDMAERVCSAVDVACIWYWKEVFCLQRSAATACLLRSHGLVADLVIGVQHTPFRAHAWVEVDGRVVNDRPYMHEMYAVLDRC
jgi:hypothetical protein